MAVINGTANADIPLNGTAVADTINGLAGDDIIRGLGGNDTIDGGTGYDTASYESDAGNGGLAGIIANIGIGTVTDGFGNTDTLIGIEALRGTEFVDRLTGSNTTVDTEQFSGFAGNDTIDGAGGFDEVRYDRDAILGGTAAVNVNLATGLVIDGFGNTDTLLNIEAARGTSQGDTFLGNAFNNDFSGLAGADTFDGGAGIDNLRYDRDQGAGGAAGISVTFSGIGVGTAVDGFGATDTFTNIEGVRGTAFVDVMTGNAGAEEFRGLASNDTLNGGQGFDVLRYDSDEFYSGGLNGVTVNLLGGTATDGFGNTDTVSNFEEVRGTRFNDSITGGNLDEVLNGGDGNDTLIGGRGSDFFQPGKGTNLVNGGPGTGFDQGSGDGDTVSYNGVGYIDVTVDLNAGTATKFTSHAPNTFEIDTLIDIERVRGTSGADTFLGSLTANFRQERYQGLAGNDTINGSNGFDIAAYQADVNNGGAAGITANLISNTVIDGFGNTDTLISVEGIIGTAKIDLFSGDSNDNRFRSQGGADTADGGAGYDVFDFYFDDQIGGTGVTVFMGGGTGTHLDGAAVSFSNFEEVNGSYRNDTIYGGVYADNILGDLGADYVDAGDGDDIVTWGGGADTVIGGNGSDWLGFRYDADWPVSAGFMAGSNAAFGWNSLNWIWTGVTVSLANGTATAPDGSTITYSGFENLSGTYYNDSLTGDGNANTFRGAAGDDAISGGGGSDTVTYAPSISQLTDTYIPFISGSAPNGVTVNLTTLSATDGEGGTDTFVSIENVIGSLGNDLITGDTGANSLSGGDANDTILGGDNIDTLMGGNGVDSLNGGNGDDVINGGDGDDLIIGAAGIDNIDGGIGLDTVSYASATGPVTIFLSTTLGAGQGSDAQGDLLTSIENVIGTNLGDSFVGAGGVGNVMNGGDGDDTFAGEGLDTIIGGTGTDVFFGGQGGALNINLGTASIETVYGSVGADVMDGSTATANLIMVAQGGAGDSMYGGSGNDFIYFRTGDDISGGLGTDWAWGANSNQSITLNLGTRGFENTWGSAFGDIFIADVAAAAVFIVGDAGNDSITGSNFGDFLYGFGDNDTLIGGGGNDIIMGGTGNDVYRYNAAAFGSDLIYDFTQGQDTFNVAGTGITNFGQITTSVLGGNTIVTSAATGASAIWLIGFTGTLVVGDFAFI